LPFVATYTGRSVTCYNCSPTIGGEISRNPAQKPEDDRPTGWQRVLFINHPRYKQHEHHSTDARIVTEPPPLANRQAYQPSIGIVAGHLGNDPGTVCRWTDRASGECRYFPAGMKPKAYNYQSTFGKFDPFRMVTQPMHWYRSMRLSGFIANVLPVSKLPIGMSYELDTGSTGQLPIENYAASTARFRYSINPDMTSYHIINKARNACGHNRNVFIRLFSSTKW
jgi:hypothetical protein